MKTLMHGVGQGLGGSALGHAVIDRQHQGRAVHHIAVPPLHTEAVIAVLDQSLEVALVQNGLIPVPFCLRPGVGLTLAGRPPG